MIGALKFIFFNQIFILFLLSNKVTLIYYVFTTIIYDPSFWQLINSFFVKCGWFGLEEIFNSLIDLLFRRTFFHWKSFARKRKSDNLLVQGRQSKMSSKTEHPSSRIFFLSCFCYIWLCKNAIESFSLILYNWTYVSIIIIKFEFKNSYGELYNPTIDTIKSFFHRCLLSNLVEVVDPYQAIVFYRQYLH